MTKKILFVSVVLFFVAANASNFLMGNIFENVTSNNLSSISLIAQASDPEISEGYFVDYIYETGQCFWCDYFMGANIEKICVCYRTTTICDPNGPSPCDEGQEVSIDKNNCEETGYNC